jgi:hypothetical protein
MRSSPVLMLFRSKKIAKSNCLRLGWEKHLVLAHALTKTSIDASCACLGVFALSLEHINLITSTRNDYFIAAANIFEDVPACMQRQNRRLLLWKE